MESRPSAVNLKLWLCDISSASLQESSISCSHTHTHLWVLKVRGFVVNAASGAVLQRIIVVNPGAKLHILFPGLVDAQVGRVNEAAQDQVCEVLREILEGHPEIEEEGKKAVRSELNEDQMCYLSKEMLQKSSFVLIQL